MSSLFQNKLLKRTFKDLKFNLYLYTLMALIILGGTLLAFYLPLPPPRMPIASEVYDQNQKLITTFFVQNRRPVALGRSTAFSD